jgi:hypothetical protein
VGTVADIIEFVNAIAFALLGLVTLRLWRSRGDEGAKWAFLTFGSLGGVAVVGLFLPEHSDSAIVDYFGSLLVAVIVLFPYFLYRIAASFQPARGWFDRVALIATAALVLWALVTPRFPEEGEPQPGWLRVFIFALLFQWVTLSVVVAIRFWRGGAGQPDVARNRMRLLSAASVLLSVVIIVAGVGGSDRSDASRVGTDLLTLASVVAFFIAFAPPRWLRALWRRPVEEAVRRATLDLMAATSADEVMAVLLPHAADVVGGEGIAVLDLDGKVIGSHGVGPVEIARSITASDEDHIESESGLVHLEFPFGAMVVRTGPYTPFFGQDEIDLLGALGALANLSLERVAADDLRARLDRATMKRQQALEINDNIVQGLAVAKYSFDLDQHDKARDAVEGTLVAARAIISELLGDLGDEAELGPGTLKRDRAATGFMDSSLTRDRRNAERDEA